MPHTRYFNLRILWPFLACSFVCLLAPSLLYSAEPDAQSTEYFERYVRPVLINRCVECHGAEEQEGGLRLDQKEAAFRGGENGPVLVPGSPEKSRLIVAIHGSNPDMAMPPEDPLDAETIRHLEQWVKMGAPWPDSDAELVSKTSPISRIKEIRGTHWAFKPIGHPSPPQTSSDWPQNDIDGFVLRRLTEAKLGPSPQADRRQLIRRAYFDLIGLPPTFDEVESFVSDTASDAYERLIDRLLSRPEYGQRWGRHWLDVARYTDTKGSVGTGIPERHVFAWTYRDYVIRAFNEDKPYDRFLTEQLAADQLEFAPDERWNQAAMGFLTLARNFPNRRDIVIGDRIDVVTRGLLGLTVMCAQCHDHKFDPLSTDDYYALYGVMDSSHIPRPDRLPLLAPAPSNPSDEYKEFEQEFQKRLDKFRKFRTRLTEKTSHEMRAFAAEYFEFIVQESMPEHRTNTVLNYKTERVVVRHETLRSNGGVILWRRYIDKRKDDPVFRPWHQLAALSRKNFADHAPRVLAETKNVNSLIQKALVDSPPKSMIETARTYGTVLEDVYARWQEHKKTNPEAEAFPDAPSEQLRLTLYGEDSPAVVRNADEATNLYHSNETRKIRDLRQEIDKLLESFVYLAPPRAVMMLDRDEPREAPIFVRGDFKRPGRKVPRRFLSLLADFDQPEAYEQGSGRLQVAQTITHPENPLTARVMVNRVWMWHFGSPLVSTPSDFGVRAAPPSHPELLDYLARRFIESGWSIKSLHRLIMNSATYQQQSLDRSDCREVDPQNVLLWRANRQRQDWESMRDSLLSVTGELTAERGGQPFVDIETPRRTVYQFLNNKDMTEALAAFDFPLPAATVAQRGQTIVPQQSLFLLNSDFVVRRARQLATRLQEIDKPVTADTTADSSSDDGKSVRQLYRWILGRDPDENELARAIKFVRSPVLDSRVPDKLNASLNLWQYGQGRYDSEKQQVVDFQVMPHFNGRRWEVEPGTPGKRNDTVFHTVDGGRVGAGPNGSAVRRWTAPEDGTFLVKGRLLPLIYEGVGDGMTVRVTSSRGGEAAKPQTVRRQSVKVRVPGIELKKGDTIDILVEAGKHHHRDTYEWPVAVYKTRIADDGTGLVALKNWKSQDHFEQSVPYWVEPLSPWAQLAQALLVSNEFMFID